MSISPTTEQQKIIDENSNCVVIAKPGSGKTFTLSHKIKNILPELPHYRGVIAISYTNKASNELKRRCLVTGVDSKSSFFGTIDTFFLAEIIIPFGTHLFGKPSKEINVIKSDELENVNSELLDFSEPAEEISEDHIPYLEQLYLDGIIILESIGLLALHIFDHSFACKRYLRARYTHIFIDEYQDCGEWQHALFIRLVNIGLTGVAVGDLDQSIFAFAGKDSKYLAELASDDDRFITFPLSENHRCHPSIINYSTCLLSPSFEPVEANEIRVFRKHLEGSEIETANWLTIAASQFAREYNTTEMNKIGILVKNRLTGNLIHRNLGIPHKAIATTPLDNDSSLWGGVFRKILFWVFSHDTTKYEFIESYLSIDFQLPVVREVMKSLREIEDVASENLVGLHKCKHQFLRIASFIFPAGKNRNAINNLEKVLQNDSLLSSFIPANCDEVQLLTLHKAKGLEFDIVFHLNLYRWIFPQYKGDYYQDLNLHYVGITRAKKCCILCTSSERHNRDGKRGAEESEFLYIHNLQYLRSDSPF